jgi:hypothetical protein
MVWAPDSPDLWAPDSTTPNRWAPDSGGHLTLGRAVDLFLAAKAAEGAAAKTLEWYGMILRRAVRGLGEDRPIEQLAGPELRAWILELRATLSPISVAGYVRTLKVLGNWLAAEELAQAAALRTLRKPRVPDKLVEPISDDAMRRLLAVADVRDRAILCFSSIAASGSPRRPACAWAICGPTARSRSWARAPRSGSCRSAAPPGRRSSATWVSAVPAHPTSRSSSADAARSTGGACSRTSSASRAGPGSPGDAARTRSATRSPGATSSTAVTCSALQRILGHTTLDMVKRYVALADVDLVARHRVASPADRLMGGRRR